MEYSGYAPEWDEVVIRGEPERGEFIAYWPRDGVIAAGMNLNVRDVNEQIRAMIRCRREVVPRLLSDVDSPLGLLDGEPSNRS